MKGGEPEQPAFFRFDYRLFARAKTDAAQRLARIPATGTGLCVESADESFFA